MERCAITIVLDPGDVDPGISRTSPTLAIVPFVGDARPSTSSGQLENNENLVEKLILDRIPDTQHQEQFLSQFADVVDVIANLVARERTDAFSSTPTILLPHTPKPCAHDGCAASMLKHIGLGSEDNLESFVDVMDDQFYNHPDFLRSTRDMALALIPPKVLANFTIKGGSKIWHRIARLWKVMARSAIFLSPYVWRIFHNLAFGTKWSTKASILVSP